MTIHILGAILCFARRQRIRTPVYLVCGSFASRICQVAFGDEAWVRIPNTFRDPDFRRAFAAAPGVRFVSTFPVNLRLVASWFWGGSTGFSPVVGVGARVPAHSSSLGSSTLVPRVPQGPVARVGYAPSLGALISEGILPSRQPCRNSPLSLFRSARLLAGSVEGLQTGGSPQRLGSFDEFRILGD